MGDFQPISCFNTIYKFITKWIANRKKGLLPKIISPTQSALKGGRLQIMSFWLRNSFSLETTTGRQGSLGVLSKWIFFLESLGLSALEFHYGDFESS